MPQGPEDIARENIDHMLTQAGWDVQDVKKVNLFAKKAWRSASSSEALL
jgi:type I site-specific restriction endonuclease